MRVMRQHSRLVLGLSPGSATHYERPEPSTLGKGRQVCPVRRPGDAVWNQRRYMLLLQHKALRIQPRPILRTKFLQAPPPSTGAPMPHPARETATPKEAPSRPNQHHQRAAELIDIRCPDCDGRGFTRVGRLTNDHGICRFCDRCDGRGSFPYHISRNERNQ